MKTIRFIISILICLNLSLFASEIEKKEMNNLQIGIDFILKEDFASAKTIFSKFITKYPNYPFGYFAMGSLYSAMMVNFETNRYNERISNYYKKTIELSEKIIDKTESKDPWLYFYIGSAKSNSGFLKGRKGEFFSAFVSTYKGISYIEDCLDSDSNFYDAKMLLGTYIYYKSSKLHYIFDNRDKGIKYLKEAIVNSYFSKYFSISALTWIYIDYEEYDKAISIANKGLEQYPDKRYFLWGKARAYFEKGDYENSNKLYKKLRINVKNDSLNNYFDDFNCCYRLAYGYYNSSQKDSAKYYMNTALSLKLSNEVKERLEDKISDLEDLKEDM